MSWYRNVDIIALKTEIHRSEAAQSLGLWEPMRPSPATYKPYMTTLYTLRAWMNGRLHVTSVPEKIRDYNREMVRTNRSERKPWTRLDRLMFNAESAEFTARHFQRKLSIEAEEPADVRPTLDGRKLEQRLAAARW